MIVNVDDFVGRFAIPTAVQNQNILKFGIKELEQSFLEELLGYEVVSFLDPSYFDIIGGTIYTTADGKNHRWSGLKASIVPYIYYHYVRGSFPQLSGIGAVNASAENAPFASPKSLSDKAWNLMVENNISLYDYINSPGLETVKEIYIPSEKLIQKQNILGI